MRWVGIVTSLWMVLTVGAQSESVQILLNHSQTRNANIGVYIQNLRTGEVIDSYRSHQVIPPASTMKVLTTATALELLGSDYRFETQLAYSGYVRDSVLYGNLYIVGRGDPTLGCLRDGQGFLFVWAKAVRAYGIRKIEGRVIADVSFFDGNALNPGWLWEDAGNYYAPSVFALSYMDNTMNIVLRSGDVGSVAQVLYTVPEVQGITFENHIRCTQTEEDGAYVSGPPFQLHRLLTGSVPSNRGMFGVKGDLPNPGLLLAQHTTSALRRYGIAIRDEAVCLTEYDLIPRTVLYTHLSDSLGSIVEQTNMHSINLYAESIYRALAQHISVPCTLPNSENIVRNFWRRRGVDLAAAILKDGCGLAPQDAVSAYTFVSLLAYMNQSSEFSSFYGSLPVSGRSGTLRGFLLGTALEGRVHAKSGTIGGTKNYVGYIEMPNGDRWAFAVLVNSASGKKRNIQYVIERYLSDVYRRNT